MVRPAISDHALLRWLERTGAVDLDPVRSQLAASLERAFTAAATLGSSQFLILADGLVYVVRNGTLVTVLPDDRSHAAILGRGESQVT